MPILVDPVNETALIFELVTSSLPIAPPAPVIRLNTPDGRSTDSHIFAINVAT